MEKLIFDCLDRNVPPNQLAREIAFLGDTLDPWVGRRQKWGYSSCGSSGPGAKHLMGPNAPNVSWRHKAWAVSLHLGPGTAAGAGMGLAGSEPGLGTGKKLIGLLKWLKAVSTKYIKGCGRQFRLPAVSLLILIILWCVVRTASP